MVLNIYTDGSCRRNGTQDAPGAWGYVVLDVEEKDIICEDYQAVKGTTNQRMELEAVIQACEKVSDAVKYPFDEAYIHTDSAYIHNCLTQKWYVKWLENGWITSSKKPVSNQDLWKRLIPFFEDSHYSFFKVGGHRGIKWNEYVDKKVQMLSGEMLINGSNN